MSTHKHIDKICCVILALTLLLTALFTSAETFGVEASARPLGYENRLFSTDKVHTIDVIIDDWDKFISTATSEEYSVCSVVIDGEAIKNVGIRGKGNTSLSSVSSMGSQRYSFKIEFDQYDSTKSYHGLDKLSLNNVIQDNTYMKDYLTYQMMNAFGVNAPLSSFAYITVNGEDWGLYLAVEAVEDSFLMRNYGSDYGELYKPDSMSFGGGRGNGKDFDVSDFMGEDGGFNFSFTDTSSMPNMGSMPSMGSSSGRPSMGGQPQGERPSSGSSSSSRPSGGSSAPSGFEKPSSGGMSGGFGGMGGFGMGSSDVKLQYIDDNASSYSNIFNNAKTDITEADKNRLIASLKDLSSYENLEDVVDIETVIRYFIVHNYVVNGDSYTGSMIHNYYLYEEDGMLSMIPWDYNLAFGTFGGSNASNSINESIDEVLSDRPMQAWIFSNEKYTEMYYELYDEFIKEVDAVAIIDNAYSLIASYVKKDPTTFCSSYEAFEKGVEALKQFCTLRSESVSLQLSGSDEKVDAGSLNISAMGTMGGGMGGGFGGDRSPSSSPSSNGQSPRPSRGEETVPGGSTPSPDSSSSATTYAQVTPTAFYPTTAKSEGTSAPSGSAPGFSWGNGEMPNMGDFDMSNFPNMGDFDMSNIPNVGGMGNMPNVGGGQRPSSGMQGGSFGSANVGFASSQNIVLLLVSFGVLGAGLLFALLFKRRR